MSEPKYIIFKVDTEHESFVVVVEWTQDEADRFAKRIALADRLTDEDGELACILFADSADVYESSHENIDWLEHNVDTDVLEKERIVVSDTEPDFPGKDRVHVSLCYVHVDATSCWWEVVPKYSSEGIWTQPITLGNYPELFETQ